MSIQVLDVYSGNDFDLKEEKAIGVDAVIFKAGQGQLGDFPRVRPDYIREAEDNGLLWGTYWLVDARYTPESQKAALKQWFPTGDFGPLGLWLDVEKPMIWMPDLIYRRLPYAYYKPIESVWRSMKEWSGEYPGWYTCPGAWQLICSAMPRSLQVEIAANARLWTAQYKTSAPDVYGAWEKPTMWQYQGEPDYSIVLDEAWWAEKTGTNVPPVPTPIPTPEPAKEWRVVEQSDAHIALELRGLNG
jgi:GH25 family lysozyme M1 (1,4-beta-N-acetylmuramidase)